MTLTRRLPTTKTERWALNSVLRARALGSEKIVCQSSVKVIAATNMKGDDNPLHGGHERFEAPGLGKPPEARDISRKWKRCLTRLRKETVNERAFSGYPAEPVWTGEIGLHDMHMDSPNQPERRMITFTPQMTPRESCPHCQKPTHWHLSVWRTFTRCLECGKNPLQQASVAENA